MHQGIKAATDDLDARWVSVLLKAMMARCHTSWHMRRQVLTVTFTLWTQMESWGRLICIVCAHSLCNFLQAFCQAELSLWLWHHAQSLADFSSHALLGASKQRCLRSCILEQQWAHPVLLKFQAKLCCCQSCTATVCFAHVCLLCRCSFLVYILIWGVCKIAPRCWSL